MQAIGACQVAVFSGKLPSMDGPLSTPPPPTDPICRTCGQGALIRRKKFRMSGPVVVIGFILLIPSVLGVLFGILTLVGILAAHPQTPSIDLQTRTRLEAQQVPEPVITQVAANKQIDDEQLAALTPQQRTAVRDAQSSVSAHTAGTDAGAVVAGGLSLFVIVMSFVGGLLGWLLIMRKRVLQCTRCGAVVPAS
jgi:hypothetical protein